MMLAKSNGKNGILRDTTVDVEFEDLVHEHGKIPRTRPIVLKSAVDLAKAPCVAWWLLEPYLERNASIMLFGDLGTLKSFLALHWALEVASQGHQVVYLSGEGKGLGKRLKGWARDRAGDNWEACLGKIPFFGVERPLNLSAMEVVQDLVQTMETGAITPALIVIDTLSKNSNGRAEATNDDATEYLNRIDHELRSLYQAAVLLVHHTGHENKVRARGAYALMANTDSNFRVDRPDAEKLVVTVTAGRMKDTESPPAFSMEASVVPTGDVDDKGNPVTTLVLRRAEQVAVASQKRPTGKCQKAILNSLERLQREGTGTPIWTLEEVRKVGSDQDFGRSSVRDAVRTLIETGFLKQTIGGLVLGYQP